MFGNGFIWFPSSSSPVQPGKVRKAEMAIRSSVISMTLRFDQLKLLSVTLLAYKNPGKIISSLIFPAISRRRSGSASGVK